MRKIGAKCQLLEHRNRELGERAVRMAVERGVALNEVLEEAAASPASRFWVEEDRALRLVAEHRRGKVQKRKCRQEMTAELARRTEALLKSRPDMELPDAVAEAVHSPAPSFYVSGRSVKRALAARKRRYMRKEAAE